jgi:hypothetical protein
METMERLWRLLLQINQAREKKKKEAKLPLLQTYDRFYKSVASYFAT